MFSMWVLVTRHCQHQLCGLFYHIDSEDNYATPVLFLTASGGLQIPSMLLWKGQKVSQKVPHVCRSAAHPDERGIWWICIYLNLSGSFKQVVPDQFDDARRHGEWARVDKTSGILTGGKIIIFTVLQATVSMLCVDEKQRTFHSMEHM